MANKRIKDLPNVAVPVAADRFPLDNVTTGSAEIGPVIAAILNGDPVPISAGGTGAETEAAARTALELGNVAVLNVGAGLAVNGADLDLAIPDDSVTFAKVQNIATARLLGRTTVGSGDIEELTVGAGLTLSGGELSSSATAATGSVINSVTSLFTTSGVAYSTTIPLDNTIPQITEGTEIQTVSITASNAANKFRIRWSGGFVTSATPGSIIVGIFKDSGADAVAAGYITGPSGDYGQALYFEGEISAGDTSAHTFRARIGPNVGTVYINGSSGGRLLGGAAACTLTVEEIKG